MPKVYVVISESIAQGYQSNGLHGVYSARAKAVTSAISAITSIAKRYHHTINPKVFTDDELEFCYQTDNLEIYVSCIEQEVR